MYHFWQEERLFSFGFLGFSRWSEKTDGFFIFRGSPAPPCPLQSAPLLRQVQECQQVVAQESEKPWPSAVTTTSARQWSVERLLHGAVVRENRHRGRVAPQCDTANARQAKAAMPPAPAQPQKARHAEAALNFSANRPVARPLLQAHPQSGKIAQCATAPDGDKRQPLRALRVVRHGITKKPGTLSRAGPGNSKTQDDSSEGGGYLPPASPLLPLM